MVGTLRMAEALAETAHMRDLISVLEAGFRHITDGEDVEAVKVSTLIYNHPEGGRFGE